MKHEEMPIWDIPIYYGEIKDGDPRLELLPNGFSARVRVLRNGILDVSSYEYNDTGRVKSSISQNAIGDRVYSWFLYSYKDDNNLSLFSAQKRSVTLDQYGGLLDISVFEDSYDADNQILNRRGVDNDGRQSLEVYKYEEGLVQSKIIFKDHDVGRLEEYKYKYDQKGRIISRSVLDNDGNIIATDFYEYDGVLPVRRGSSTLDRISIYKARLILGRIKKDRTRKKDRNFVVYENRANDLVAILEAGR